jgi:hypothetical protein
MDYFKGLFSYFKARPRPVALENSPLNRLPNEVLLCIIDFLPASSAASFSLSCLQIQHRIGNRYIKNLSCSTEDTVEFLNLLERDLPDQIACSACKKFHKIKHARRYMERSFASRSRSDPACVRCDWRNRTGLYLHGNFSSVVFKMAMKRYNQNNPEYTKLLKLLERKLGRRRDFVEGTHINQYEAQIRITNGSLFIRQRMAFYLKWYCSYSSYDGWQGLYFWICPHHTYRNHQNPSHSDSGLQQCHHCRTEYQIDFRSHSRHVLVAYCTRWKELGAGPDDRTWKAHIDGHSSSSSSVQLNVGEVSSAFQQGEPFEVGSLLWPKDK